MNDRAFHPCRFCGNPISANDWNSGIYSCGQCPLARASANDIEIAHATNSTLPTCSYCHCELKPRTDGHVNSICFECANGRMIRCLVPGHQGKQETREIHIRSVAYYVSNQRHKDHGRTLQLNGCLKCIAVKRLELWKDYVARTSKQYDKETGVLIPPNGQATLILTSPWDSVGGIRNRWKPSRGINGKGQWIAFEPLGFKCIIDVETERWVLHVQRLTKFDLNGVPEFTEGSIVHQGVNQWVREITRPLISTSEHVARGSAGVMQRTIANERREVMKPRDMGWCFVGVKSTDKDDHNKHVLMCSRFADHAMHWPSHSKREWFDHCMKEFVK